MCGVFLKKNKIREILIVGGTGNLGQNIIKYYRHRNLVYPGKENLNILNKQSIIKNIKKNTDVIINCAGLPRIRECESKPDKAFQLNVIGVKNLVESVLKAEKKFKKKISLIHLSSDAVYKSLSGNYKENDKCIPQNIYGKTKLQGEKFVKKLKNYTIIRTRFFNKNKIKYKDAAIDIFSSMIEIQKLVKIIFFLNKISFNGVINVGGPRKSDFNILKKFKDLKKTNWKSISKKSNVFISKDSSLNLEKLKKIIRNNKKK